MQLGRARWYIDADTLGVAAVLARARPDVTFPGDTGERHTSRWRLPPCAMTSTDIPDVEWIPKVTAAGLAVITRDRAMLSRRREAAAIVEAGAQMFTIAPTLSIHGDLAGGVSERRKVPLTWENEGVEANILP